MPVVGIENIYIEFEYEGKNFTLDKYKIYDYYGNYLFMCDFTGTNYYGNVELMEFAAKMCVKAYLSGFHDGKDFGREDLQKSFKRILGL